MGGGGRSGGRGVKGGAGEGGGHHPWLVPASLYEVRRKRQRPAANKSWLHTLVLERGPRVGTYQLEYGCISIDKEIDPLVFLCLFPLPFTFPVTQHALYS